MDTLAPLLALPFSHWKSPVSVDAAGAVELSEIPLSVPAIPHMMRLSALIGESPGWRRRWGLRGAGSDVTWENNRGLKYGSPGGRRLSCGSVSRGCCRCHVPSGTAAGARGPWRPPLLGLGLAGAAPAVHLRLPRGRSCNLSAATELIDSFPFPPSPSNLAVCSSLAVLFADALGFGYEIE